MAASLAGALACAPSPPEPPNIVLITVDTLRADRLEPYGNDRIATPNVARLAREGIVFESAFADATWTVPSVSSVMTGTYPTRHRVHTWFDRLGDDQTTLAERLRDHGYATAAIVSSFPLDRNFGFSQGFDAYDDRLDSAFEVARRAGSESADWRVARAAALAQWQASPDASRSFRLDDRTADLAIAWLDSNRAAPFFLWVHFFGPHEKTPTGLETARRIAAYDPDVAFLDAQLGRVLDRLDRDRRAGATAVILHSDHGESLGENGIVGHGLDVFDTTAHVPLIVRLPDDERAGERVATLVRNVDILPTVLAIAGAETPAGLDGRDLLDAPTDTAHAYLETYNTVGLHPQDSVIDGRTRRVGDVLCGVRTRNFKLVAEAPALVDPDDAERLTAAQVARGRRVHLYDLIADPGEHRDLAKERPQVTADLLAELDTHPCPQARTSTRAELDEDARARLHAIGYLNE